MNTLNYDKSIFLHLQRDVSNKGAETFEFSDLFKASNMFCILH